MTELESKYSQKFQYSEKLNQIKKIKSKPNVTQIPKYKSIQPNFSKLIHISYADLRNNEKKKKKLTSDSSLYVRISNPACTFRLSMPVPVVLVWQGTDGGGKMMVIAGRRYELCLLLISVSQAFFLFSFFLLYPYVARLIVF